MSAGDPPTSASIHVGTLPIHSTVAEAMAEYRRLNGLNPLSGREVAELPPWTDEEAEAFARSIRDMNYPTTGPVGGPTVAEALDDYWRSKGMNPPRRERLTTLPPWPEEDATAFEKVISDMFKRIEEEPRPLWTWRAAVRTSLTQASQS